MELEDLENYDGRTIHELFRRPVYELDLAKAAKDRSLIDFFNKKRTMPFNLKGFNVVEPTAQ